MQDVSDTSTDTGQYEYEVEYEDRGWKPEQGLATRPVLCIEGERDFLPLRLATQVEAVHRAMDLSSTWLCRTFVVRYPKDVADRMQAVQVWPEYRENLASGATVPVVVEVKPDVLAMIERVGGDIETAFQTLLKAMLGSMGNKPPFVSPITGEDVTAAMHRAQQVLATDSSQDDTPPWQSE